jgi:hypothetical protein
VTFRAWQCSAENMSSPCLWIMSVGCRRAREQKDARVGFPGGVKKHGGAGGLPTGRGRGAGGFECGFQVKLEECAVGCLNMLDWM